MGNGFIGWFERSYKIIIVVLVAIMAAASVTLAVQHVNAARPAAGTAAGPIPTFTSAPRYEQAAIPDGATVLFIGDSFTQGYGSTNESKDGWAPLVAAKMRWDATIDGVGNTGYTAGGQVNGAGDRQFINRLPAHAELRPDVVIFQGSQNDFGASRTDLITAVEATFSAAKKLWPDAVILAMGTSAPQPAGDQYAGISEAVGQAASNSDVPFISPVGNHWFTTTNSPNFAYTDGQHLNDAGYEYLASRVEDELANYLVTR